MGPKPRETTPPEAPLAVPISATSPKEVWDSIRALCGKYKRNGRTFLHWVRCLSKVPIKTWKENGETRIDLVSLKQGVDDIVARRLYLPGYVRAALADIIDQRKEVSDLYVKLEWPHLSQSTLGHRKYMEEMARMKVLLDTLDPPPTVIDTGNHSADVANTNYFHLLRSEYDNLEDEDEAEVMVIDGDQLWEEMKIAEAVALLIYLLYQALIRYKAGVASPASLAAAAWVAIEAHTLTLGICCSLTFQTGLDERRLLKKLDDMHTKGKYQALEILPLHQYVDQFRRMAEDVFPTSHAVIRSKLESMKLKAANMIQNDLQHSQHSIEHTSSVLKQLLVDSHSVAMDVPDDDVASLCQSWYQSLPLISTISRYVASRSHKDALFATVDAMFLLQTTAAAARGSDDGMIEKSFYRVTGFAVSVKHFIKKIPQPIIILFEPQLFRKLDNVSNLCDLIEHAPMSTATAFPWALGTQVLAILKALDAATPDMIHQHMIVGVVVHAYNALRRKVQGFERIAIFEALSTVVESEVFIEKSPPTADFHETFLRYSKNHASILHDVSEANDGESDRRGPSVVHSCPFPTGELQVEITEALRETSINPESLPAAAEWTVIQTMEEMRSAADREFAGPVPVARVNFIAVFLLCAEVLMIFDKSTKVLLTADQASWMVNKTVKILEELDTTGTGVISGTGYVAALAAAFRTFANRSKDGILWSKM
ncbi:hypothetical protein SLS60_005810 [Paraconiothyrium brasiliense]|uniref:EF-hand domain-containing protein n=1 Tax=Paraconiothyrium brasiliense TaxID=300254 RepID=A0ABR3RD70_9PLEO